MPRGKVKGTGSARNRQVVRDEPARRSAPGRERVRSKSGGALSRRTRQADDECPSEALRGNSSLQAGSRRGPRGGTSEDTVGSDVHYPSCLRV